MQRLLMTMIFLFASSMAYSSTPLPESCAPVPFKIENNNIVLSSQPDQPKTSQIYFITNYSQQSIFIDHPSSNPGASAGWSSYLRSGHWSALALNKKSFAIQCAMIQPGKVVMLNCSKTIRICAPKNLTTKNRIKGNYWLAEDKEWEGFVKALSKRGVGF